MPVLLGPRVRQEPAYNWYEMTSDMTTTMHAHLHRQLAMHACPLHAPLLSSLLTEPASWLWIAWQVFTACTHCRSVSSALHSMQAHTHALHGLQAEPTHASRVAAQLLSTLACIHTVFTLLHVGHRLVCCSVDAHPDLWHRLRPQPLCFPPTRMHLGLGCSEPAPF